jgi:streptogramin lyase
MGPADDDCDPVLDYELIMIRSWMMLIALIAVLTAGITAHAKMEMRTFPVLAGAGAHDVYLALDGAVWFTAQSGGKLGRLAHAPAGAPFGISFPTDGRFGVDTNPAPRPG